MEIVTYACITYIEYNLFINPRCACAARVIVNDLLEHHSLYIVSQSSISNGPNYTFFRDSCHSTIDYIIASSAIAGYTLNCFVHPHHPLNLSDHLPISISLDCTTPPVTATLPDSQNVNLLGSCC